MNKRTRRCGIGMGALQAGVVLGAAMLVVGVVAAPANGAINIYETTEDATLLGKIRKGKCRVRGEGGGRYLRATAKSTNRDYELSLTILKWDGYGDEYDFRRGTSNPGVFYLRGRGGPYSNIFAPPGTNRQPACGAGFRGGGERMSVGFLPTPNESFRKGVVLAGTMRCRG
jgi:hypothetical protein